MRATRSKGARPGPDRLQPSPRSPANRALTCLAAVSLALGGCGSEDSAPTRTGEVERVAVRVRLLAAAQAPQRIAREARLRAPADLLLRAQTSGHITTRPLAEGARSAAGTLLLSFDDAEERAVLAAARARLAQLLAAPYPLAERRNLERELAAAERRLAERHLRAPGEGRIVEHHREVGEWVARGEPLVRWIRSGPPTVTLDLLETEVARIASQGGIRVALARDPTRQRAARLLRIAPAAESGSGRFLVEVALDLTAPPTGAAPPDSESARPAVWLPGTLVRVSLPLQATEPGFPLEGDALRTRFGLERVLIVTEEGGSTRVEERTVTSRELPGRPGLRLITSGLEAGSRVVVRGALGLAPGSPVRVTRVLKGEP